MNSVSSFRVGKRLQAALAFAVSALIASAAAGASPTAANLVRNGDAEEGEAATNNEVFPPPGWVTTGTFTALKYGQSGAPTSGGGGANLFAGGPGAAVSTATQTVDVSASATAIDAGTARATLSALLGGWESQGDDATVEAFFVNSTQVVLGSFAIGPVTAGDRGSRTTMLPRSKTQSVPPGTRRIRVLITAERSAGTYNDGYADNVSLTLTAGAPTRAHYRFGFRISDRSIGLSAGSSGSFTTEGQPTASGELKVVSVAAKLLTVGWRYRGNRYHVKLRFTGKGTYFNGAVALVVSVRSSNVAKCKPGRPGYVGLRRSGDVVLRFCGNRIEFLAPERASSWIKSG